LFWLLIIDGGLVLIDRKDAGWDWILARHHLSQFIGCFVKSSGNVIEFEAIELVLQLAYYLAVHSHLRVVAA
jgi:hypothetical protein